MRSLYKGLILTAAQLALVTSLGAKLLIDRQTCPRVWVRTAPVDPDLPIRGRYVSLQAEVDASRIVFKNSYSWGYGKLTVENGQLIAVPATSSTGVLLSRPRNNVAVIAEPLAFFIPEHATDPSRRAPGEELWVEVTVPRQGPPRPIRLGVKRDGVLTPLHLQ